MNRVAAEYGRRIHDGTIELPRSPFPRRWS